MIGCIRVGSPVDRIMTPPGSDLKLWVRNLPRSVDHPKRKTQARPRGAARFFFSSGVIILGLGLGWSGSGRSVILRASVPLGFPEF